MLPEKIRVGGLVILRDGYPGEPEQALGGFGNTYYQRAVETKQPLGARSRRSSGKLVSGDTGK